MVDLGNVRVGTPAMPMPYEHQQHMSDDEKAALRRILAVIETFRAVHPTAPIHLVSAFLRVAIEEGKGNADYAREAKVAPTVMSRHLLDLGAKMRSNKPGLGLVETERNPQELRRLEASLTREGAKLARDMIKFLTTRK